MNDADVLLWRLRHERALFDALHPDLDPVARANIDAIRAEEDRALGRYTPEHFRAAPPGCHAT